MAIIPSGIEAEGNGRANPGRGGAADVVMKRVDYDRVASAYDRRYRDGEPPGLAAFIRERGAHAGDRPVLDVGCGTGRWTQEVMAPGRHAIGLDPSTAMLARARARLPAPRSCAVGRNPCPSRAAASAPWCAST